MSGYYYLIAQLPMLLWGNAPPIKRERFLELCRDLLSRDDYCLLASLEASRNATAGANGLSSLIDRYSRWENELRRQLARLRSARIKRDLPPIADDVVGTGMAIEYRQESAAAARAILAAESPLDVEIGLDRVRWEAIENLQGVVYFSRDTVFAYYLKLRLLERRAAFRADTGSAVFSSIYASMMSAATTNASGEPK